MVLLKKGSPDFQPKVIFQSDQVGLATELTLSSIDGKIIIANTDNVTVVSEPAYDSLNDRKKVSIESDSVGLAKDSTLSLLLTQADIKISELRDALRPSVSTPTQDLSAAVIPGGGTKNIDKTILDGWKTLVVTVSATYVDTATAGVRIRWLYSPDGVNYDSVDDAEAQNHFEDLTFRPGATRQRTIQIPILQPYVRVQIENQDRHSHVAVSVWSTLVR